MSTTATAALHLALVLQISLVSPCIRLSPSIEAKIAGLARLVTTTAAPSTANLSSSASSEQNIVFQARVGDRGEENSVNIRSAVTKTTRSPTTSPFMYTNRYDFVAIEQVLTSPRLMRNFHECMMGRGPCTSEGSELKRIVPEALRSNCARCTEKQRVQAGKVLVYLLEHRPEWWKELLEKFDPDGRFRKQYEYEEDDEEERNSRINTAS